MQPYPVQFEMTRPQEFERHHVALRLVVLGVLTMLGVSLGWTFALLYLLLPAYAALTVGKHGPDRFLADDAPAVTRFLRWVLAFYAYLAVLTDRLPTSAAEIDARYEVTPTGPPRAGSALARLLTSIPAVIFLAVLGVIGCVTWVFQMLTVLLHKQVPESLYGVQLGVMRFQARLLAYHASLVDEYPPFTLDTHAGTAAPTASGMA